MTVNRWFLTTVLGAVLGAAACSGHEPTPFEPITPPGASAWSGEGSDGEYGWGDTKPTSCKPLKAESASRDIGVEGGGLRIGPHTLIIPAGALLETVRITGQIISDTVNSIRFLPEGLQFLVPATLQMSYKNCKAMDLTWMKLIYTSDDMSQLLEQVPSLDKKDKDAVAGFINHFSRYAVAY